MTQPSNHELTAAIDVVRSACGIARAVQKDLESVSRIIKDDKSPVTVADYAVQAAVAMGLRAALGEGVRIVGEEHTGDLERSEAAAIRQAVTAAVKCTQSHATESQVMAAIAHCGHDGSGDAYWVLDPVDGTKGFLRGQQYAIALGKIEHGRVVLGVMGCPNMSTSHSADFDAADPHGAVYWATGGGGAWAEPGSGGSRKRINASMSRGSGPLRVCESVEAAHSKQDDTRRILEAMGHANATPVRLDSQGKYAVVARGQADGYLRLPTKKGYVEKVWDHAAGAIIAQEAGAVVTDIAGNALDFSRGRLLDRNRGIVCAAPWVHDSILRVIDELAISAPSTT